ncbi:hypothetical protein BCR44DRAFT_40652, partial [Catenaria anguillulae PL171]
MLGRVAKQGHVHVIEWWTSKSSAGMIQMPPLAKVVSGALKGKHGFVLQWSKKHPECVQQLNALKLGEREHVLEYAVKSRLWIGLPASESVYLKTSIGWLPKQRAGMAI